MCTCTDHSRLVILLTEHASRHRVQDFDVAIRTLNRATLITRHKPTTARRLKLIQALPGRRHHFHVHTSRYQETSYQNIGGWCRYTVLDDHITTRASSKADLGRYSTLLVASKRTSSDFYGKRTIFSFDKAENTEIVYMYVYIFHSDPRVVFSVAA